MKILKLFLSMFIIVLLPIMAYSIDYANTYSDSSDLVLDFEKIDTLKALMFFSVSSADGFQIDTMKVMYDWTRDIWDPEDTRSIPNYFNKTSYFKHHITGESAPSGDTMFVSSYPVSNNSFYISGYYFLDIMEQVDDLYDLSDFDITLYPTQRVG